jgi:Zn-dependent protease
MMDTISQLIIMAPPLLFALTLHEYAHGYVAYRLGDPTAYNAGRLTLNPLSHLDPIGTIAFFFIKFGWAKPVPVNPMYFREPRKGMLWVALAGPITNLVLAVISAILVKVTLYILINSSSALLGSILGPLLAMLVTSVWINLVLCIFNFLPIPPLDGSRIVTGLLPEHLAGRYASFERYGFIVILLLAFSGVLSTVIFPIIRFANNLLLA